MKTASLLLLLVASSITIDTTYAITRRLGSTHHSLAGCSSSSSSLPALGLQLSGDTATIARAQQELRRQRRYSPATSSNKSLSSATTPSTSIASASELLRGGGVIEKKKNQFGDGVCVDNEGNLYSSSASASTAHSMKIRGGGVCVDNEGNFYSPRSVVAAAPQHQEQERSQQPSLAAANHRRTIPASSKSSISSSSKTAVPASFGSKQLGLGRRRKTSSSLSPSFRSSAPSIRGGGGGLKNNINMNVNKHRIGDLCVDKEGNLYSSLSTLRGGGGNSGGGGGLCVDNEGNFYSSPSR